MSNAVAVIAELYLYPIKSLSGSRCRERTSAWTASWEIGSSLSRVRPVSTHFSFQPCQRAPALMRFTMSYPPKVTT